MEEKFGPYGVVGVGVGWNERPGDGIGGGGSASGGSERRRLRDLLLFMKLSGFNKGFLRDSVVRLDSAEWMLNVSDGRAVEVVETLMVEGPE